MRVKRKERKERHSYNRMERKGTIIIIILLMMMD